jgi:hypothetical protein
MRKDVDANLLERSVSPFGYFKGTYTMAMASKCGGCGDVVSHIFAAQFCNSPMGQEVIVCYSCWMAGVRCYYGPGGLVVAKEPPTQDHKLAELYWDEGGHVTGGKIPVVYPRRTQYAPVTRPPETRQSLRDSGSVG